MEHEMNLLKTLVEKWKNRARKKYSDAQSEQTSIGKRFVEHGADCYLNCADDLQSVIDVLAEKTDEDFAISTGSRCSCGTFH